jgi:hypothetical protein
MHVAKSLLRSSLTIDQSLTLPSLTASRRAVAICHVLDLPEHQPRPRPVGGGVYLGQVHGRRLVNLRRARSIRCISPCSLALVRATPSWTLNRSPPPRASLVLTLDHQHVRRWPRTFLARTSPRGRSHTLASPSSSVVLGARHPVFFFHLLVTRPPRRGPWRWCSWRRRARGRTARARAPGITNKAGGSNQRPWLGRRGELQACNERSAGADGDGPRPFRGVFGDRGLGHDVGR